MLIYLTSDFTVETLPAASLAPDWQITITAQRFGIEPHSEGANSLGGWQGKLSVKISDLKTGLKIRFIVKRKGNTRNPTQIWLE